MSLQRSEKREAVHRSIDMTDHHDLHRHDSIEMSPRNRSARSDPELQSERLGSTVGVPNQMNVCIHLSTSCYEVARIPAEIFLPLKTYDEPRADVTFHRETSGPSPSSRFPSRCWPLGNPFRGEQCKEKGSGRGYELIDIQWFCTWSVEWRARRSHLGCSTFPDRDHGSGNVARRDGIHLSNIRRTIPLDGHLCTAEDQGLHHLDARYVVNKCLAWKTPSSCLHYLSGWITVFAWQAAVTSICYLFAGQVQGLAILNHPEYVPQRWHATLIMWATIAVAFAINIYCIKLLPTIQLVGGIFHVIFFIVLIVPLVVLAPRSTPEFVFTELLNEGGWKSDGVSWCLGMLTVTYCFTGMFLIYSTRQDSTLTPSTT